MASISIDRFTKAIRETFAEDLDAAFKKRWRRNLTTEYNIIAVRMISRPTNGKPFTPEQKAWVDGYADGRSNVLDKLWERRSIKR